jgi:hypothetical protein
MFQVMLGNTVAHDLPVWPCLRYRYEVLTPELAELVDLTA